MKKILTLMLAASVIAGTAAAQKKYDKLVYKDAQADNGDVSIVVKDAVSTEAETKLKVKLTNKTADYVIYKPNESKFIINGKEYAAEEKQLVIGPDESDYKIINLKGSGYNAVKSYSFKVDGMYKVSTSGTVVPAADFRLPPTKNEFKAGGYDAKLGKLSKDTKKTSARFDISYHGDKTGVVFPGKAGAKMPDGNEYANAKSKPKPILLSKGEEDYFTLEWDRMQGGGKTMDMQFAEMMIKWNETFTEATPEKMKSATVTLDIDEAASK